MKKNFLISLLGCLLAFDSLKWLDGAHIIQSAGNDGHWGTWGNPSYCPPEQYVYGMRLRSEHKQGSGDDTALNDITLLCSFKQGPDYSYIHNKGGPYGTWLGTVASSSFSDPVVGYSLQIEPKQGGDDDSAANNLALYTKNGVALIGQTFTSWGVWQTANYCPQGWAVVGFVTRVEDPQGSDDDTSLNGVRMFCKPF